MSWGRRIAHLRRILFGREQIERELDDEVRAYFDILIDRYMARGLSREKALRAARMAAAREAASSGSEVRVMKLKALSMEVRAEGLVG